MESIAGIFYKYNDVFDIFALFDTKLLQKKKKCDTMRAESKGKRRMEKNFIVTKISHIIMVGEEEYPEKKTSFSHDLKHHELIFSLRGRATVFFNGERLETEKGTVRFLPAGPTEQYVVVRQENGACIDIFFDTDLPISEKAFVMNPKQSEKLEGLFKKAVALWASKEEGYYFECISLIYRIFAELQKQSYVPTEHAEKIAPAVALIRERFLTNEIRISELCEASSISESYLKRLFREKYGTSPKQYIIQLKINHACELLRLGRYTVTQVAELCNFSDVYFFSRQFKAYMGITPTQFVQKYKSSK